MKTREFFFASALCLAAMLASADIVAYQVTARNTPQSGYSGQVVAAQACSTNSTSTATVYSVTKLNVGGTVIPFTNNIATVSVVNGVGSSTPTNVFVASKQDIGVSGDAFPGGSVILWIKE